MKRMKPILALLLTATLLAALTAAPALAAENPGTITIRDALDGSSYELYRIFDLSADADYAALAYTVNETWEAFFFGENAPGAVYLTAGEAGATQLVHGGVRYAVNLNEGNVARFAEDALDYCATLADAPTVTATAEADGDLTVSDLPLGYYLVYPVGAVQVKGSYGSICSLTNTVPAASVAIKAEAPAFSKTADDDFVEVGQVVTFTIRGVVPDTTGFRSYTYAISDAMSEGLSFCGVEDEAFTVTVSGAETQDYAATETDNGFELAFDILGNGNYPAGAEIVVRYTATVNAAAIEREKETNTATLRYSNKPKTDDVGEIETVVELYSANLRITKVAAGSEDTTLPGAQFILKNGDRYYRWDEQTEKVVWTELRAEATVAESGRDGIVRFDGLSEGSYVLEEVKAPEGYNRLTEGIAVEISRDADGVTAAFNGETAAVSRTQTVAFAVENASGAALPETGGVGTTLFLVFGALAVMTAGVFLVTNRRMKKEGY